MSENLDARLDRIIQLLDEQNAMMRDTIQGRDARLRSVAVPIINLLSGILNKPIR